MTDGPEILGTEPRDSAVGRYFLPRWKALRGITTFALLWRTVNCVAVPVSLTIAPWGLRRLLVVAPQQVGCYP